MEDIRTSRRTRNRMLAARLRNRSIQPNGVAWAEAKAVRDHLIDEGVSPAKACREAAKAVQRAGSYVEPEKAPVAQAPEPKAEPKPLPAQAQRVREGKVLRDAKGRILPKATQELYEELASLQHDLHGVTGDYESFAGGRVTA